jgi:hypothetical protein
MVLLYFGLVILVITGTDRNVVVWVLVAPWMSTAPYLRGQFFFFFAALLA